MLLSLVLVGTSDVKRKARVEIIRKPPPGYDSYASDRLGAIIAIFDSTQVMPLYRVTVSKFRCWGLGAMGLRGFGGLAVLEAMILSGFGPSAARKRSRIAANSFRATTQAGQSALNMNATPRLKRMVAGEAEARRRDRCAVFRVHDQGRNYNAEETAEQNHFNRAVARLTQMAGGVGKVEAVEYVVNPALQVVYERKKAEMMALLALQGGGKINEQLLCHGTSFGASENIIRTNFSMRTGATNGIRFSENARLNRGGVWIRAITFKSPKQH